MQLKPVTSVFDLFLRTIHEVWQPWPPSSVTVWQKSNINIPFLFLCSVEESQSMRVNKGWQRFNFWLNCPFNKRCMHSTRARTHTHTHTHARMHAHTHTHTHAHARTHAHTHTHTHACTHARTHACTHTHTRTHARTHAHTHTPLKHKNWYQVKHSLFFSLSFTFLLASSPKRNGETNERAFWESSH